MSSYGLINYFFLSLLQLEKYFQRLKNPYLRQNTFVCGWGGEGV